MNNPDQDAEVRGLQVYAYVSRLSENGATPTEIRQKLIEKGLDAQEAARLTERLTSFIARHYSRLGRQRQPGRATDRPGPCSGGRRRRARVRWRKLSEPAGAAHRLASIAGMPPHAGDTRVRDKLLVYPLTVWAMPGAWADPTSA
jgi:hypothetical protein